MSKQCNYVATHGCKFDYVYDGNVIVSRGVENRDCDYAFYSCPGIRDHVLVLTKETK